MRILFFILLLSFSVFAIGISPGDFEVETKKGEIIEKDFYVYNTDNKDKEFKIVVEGYDWFSFFPSDLEIKANSKEKVKVILEIPDNIGKGIYLGKIYFKENSNGEGLRLNPGVLVSYKIDVKEGVVYYGKEEKLRIYQSASVFEKDVKEVVEKEEIGLDIISFAVLGVLVFILMILVMMRVVRLTKHL